MNTDITSTSHALNEIERVSITSNRSSRLCKTLAASVTGKVREIFDPTNADHIAKYKHFKQHGKWPNGSNPFKMEWPFSTIPAAIESKIIQHAIGL